MWADVLVALLHWFQFSFQFLFMRIFSTFQLVISMAKSPGQPAKFIDLIPVPIRRKRRRTLLCLIASCLSVLFRDQLFVRQLTLPCLVIGCCFQSATSTTTCPPSKRRSPSATSSNSARSLPCILRADVTYWRHTLASDVSMSSVFNSSCTPVRRTAVTHQRNINCF